MAQNFLYMFEFVVDDLLITQPNECAPDEYPTCCELTFRSSVFVSICDCDFGGCLDSSTTSKNGKCCLFGLESPITKEDQLHVHIYKKKIEKCKFLLGTTDFSVHNLFEETTSMFFEDNPSLGSSKVKGSSISNCMGKSNSNKNTIDKNGDSDKKFPRQEEFCPSSKIEKKLLSLFDLKGRQTGNLVLVIRLSCMGPTIVSPFPFKNSNKYKPCPSKNPPPCIDPCKKTKHCSYTPKAKPCSCCNGCEDNEEEGGEECSECSEVSSIYPCAICPTPKEPGPEAFDEFEANLNGSGMVVRVLKNSHYVQSVADSDYESDNEDGGCQSHHEKSNSGCGKSFQKSSFLKNTMKSSVGGKYLNEKGLPKIRGNFKYAANNVCQNFELPMPVIRECDGTNDKLNKYRKCPPENRNCCMQVQGYDIDKTLKGINENTTKNGIEICHEKCVETDSDIFILKLGKKQKLKNKQNIIEIELKTPKCPVIINHQKHTRETQIDEVELDAILKDICAKKKKGKKK